MLLSRIFVQINAKKALIQNPKKNKGKLPDYGAQKICHKGQGKPFFGQTYLF